MSKNTFPRKITDIKGKTAIDELRRAHYIIVILAVALAFLVVTGVYQPLELDTVLGLTAVALLVVIGLVSLGTAIKLGKK